MDKYNELFETKRKLYALLLQKQVEQLTEAEINLMYDLSQDKDLQSFIESAKINRKVESNG